LQRGVVLVGFALALVPRLVGENVVTLFPQLCTVQLGRPAVGAELRVKQDNAAAFALAAEVGTLEGDAVDGLERDVLGVGQFVAARADEERLLLEDAMTWSRNLYR
jgi:hypothetical protein